MEPSMPTDLLRRRRTGQRSSISMRWAVGLSALAVMAAVIATLIFSAWAWQ
jgi:hypothetical protein